MKTTTQIPSPVLLKVRELILVVFKEFWRFSFPLGKAEMVLVAGEVSMMRERGYMVEMSASSNSVGVALPAASYNALTHCKIGLPPLGEGQGRGFWLRAKHATLGRYPH